MTSRSEKYVCVEYGSFSTEKLPRFQRRRASKASTQTYFRFFIISLSRYARLFRMKRESPREIRRVIWKALKIAFEFLLDTIAPPDANVKKIELLSSETFLEEAMRGEKLEESPGVLHFLPYRSTVVKTAIIEIKTHENRKIAFLLATLLYDFLLSELSDLEMFQNFTSPLVLPIPITRKKKRKRGWNQCDLLAQAMKKIDRGKTFEIRTDILQKIRENEDQVGKGRTERFKNLENCFRVRDEMKTQGRNVIIFDDIVTTGATLSEAKRTLLSAGAKKVVSVALAH
ncbi:MAG: phosphoribosyltransferase family protein [Patescibacteria group bacterium]